MRRLAATRHTPSGVPQKRLGRARLQPSHRALHRVEGKVPEFGTDEMLGKHRQNLEGFTVGDDGDVADLAVVIPDEANM